MQKHRAAPQTPCTSRSENMRRIKSKNTAPELAVRSLLHRMGFRFRLHDRDLPGHPDIVLPKWKCVIFVNGCFWHRHQDCRAGGYSPKTNAEYWQKKFAQVLLLHPPFP